MIAYNFIHANLMSAFMVGSLYAVTGTLLFAASRATASQVFVWIYRIIVMGWLIFAFVSLIALVNTFEIILVIMYIISIISALIVGGMKRKSQIVSGIYEKGFFAKWFRNISIRYKLLLGFSLMFAITVILSLFALLTLHNFVYTFYVVRNYPDRRLSIVREIELQLAHGQIATLEGNSVANFERDVLLLIEEYISNTREDIFINIYMPETRFTSVQSRAMQLSGEIENFFYSGLSNDLDIVRASISYLYAFEHEYSVNMEEGISGLSSEINLITVIALVICLIFAIIVARSIANPISSNIKMAATTLQGVAVGNLNLNIDTSKLAEDEVGGLVNDIYTLTNTIRNMVDDLSNVHTQYITAGNMRYQMDDSKYQNSFKEMIVSVNALLNSVTNDMSEIGGAMDKLSSGDFNVQIDPAAWVGDWAKLPQSAHNLSAGLVSISNEINAMIEAIATRGDLTFKTDETRYKGDWQKIMAGLNSIAKAVDTPLSEINSVMEKLSQGQFDSTISGNYAGVFSNTKRSVNTTIGTLSGYISEITNSLSRVANGDLTHTINRNYVGSFSAIKNSLNNISTTLNKTMLEISTAADQVLEGANQISSSATNLSNGAQMQANSVYDLTITIDTISQQTKQNANNANIANELSNKSTTNAQEGSSAMKQMVDAMNQIKESSNSISRIVKTVQDISFQTILLALNASVEAARAGEHGRGFAVVAEEVRNLAGRSQEAAEETTSLIQDSIRRVDSGAVIAITTAESLNAIVASASEVLEVISNISSASKEQAEAIANVSDGLAQISDVTLSNSAVSEETAAASEELNAQAEVLRQLVAYFKL